MGVDRFLHHHAGAEVELLRIKKYFFHRGQAMPDPFFIIYYFTNLSINCTTCLSDDCSSS
jgi:hypothetical protein